MDWFCWSIAVGAVLFWLAMEVSDRRDGTKGTFRSWDIFDD